MGEALRRLQGAKACKQEGQQRSGELMEAGADARKAGFSVVLLFSVQTAALIRKRRLKCTQKAKAAPYFRRCFAACKFARC